MTSLPSDYKFTVGSGSLRTTIPLYVKVFGQYLIEVSHKSLREVKLRQKGNMSSVLDTIASKKGRIMSDENIRMLCTAYHSYSETVPYFS